MRHFKDEAALLDFMRKRLKTAVLEDYREAKNDKEYPRDPEMMLAVSQDVHDYVNALTFTDLDWTVTAARKSGEPTGHFTTTIQARSLSDALDKGLLICAEEWSEDADELYILHVLEGKHTFVYYDDAR